MIDNLPERRALSILESYDGSNDYILRLKKNLLSKKSFKLTRSQSDYIIDFHQTKPRIAKKWVEMDSYFSKKMMKDKLLTKVPEKIYVEKLLVEKNKSFHIWGKLFENQKLEDIWLPKSALVKNKERKVTIDYSKYDHRPPLDHQKKAIEKLVGNDKFILADDMGLGKTTSTVIASLESDVKKVLIVCPASLKINWMREIENYTDKTISIIEGKKWIDSEYVIINYDILKNFHSTKKGEMSKIIESDFDLVIMDEALHSKQKRTKKLRMI